MRNTTWVYDLLSKVSCGILKLRVNIWYLIQTKQILLHGFDQGLLTDRLAHILTPNPHPDLINGAY